MADLEKYCWRVVYQDGRDRIQQDADDHLGKLDLEGVIQVEFLPVQPSLPPIAIRIDPRLGERFYRSTQYTASASTGQVAHVQEVFGLECPPNPPMYVVVDLSGTIWISSSLDF